MTAPQRSPEWHAARIGRVTGSEVGAILGLSPYRTRADVMRSMVRASLGAPSEFTGNVATEWGTAMEPQARQDYEMDAQQNVTDAPFFPYGDWLGASPDGFVGKDGLVEFKCPYGIRNDNPPTFKSLADQPYYVAQVQIEMFCARKEWTHFYQWTPYGQKLEYAERDGDWLNTHLLILRQFYEEFLHELEHNAEEHLAPLRAEVDTPAAAALVREYDELAEQIELATERKKELLAEIVTLAGDRNALVAGRKLTKVEKEGAISYAKAVAALAPGADLSKWRGKASSYWRLG